MRTAHVRLSDEFYREEFISAIQEAISHEVYLRELFDVEDKPFLITVSPHNHRKTGLPRFSKFEYTVRGGEP